MADSAAIRAGGGVVELGVDKTSLEYGLKVAKDNLADWGKGIAAIGGVIAGVGAAITAPFLASIPAFASAGGEIVTAARRTGLGFEQLQSLNAALGGDLDSTTSGLMKMGIWMRQLANGGQEASLVAGRLGLSFEQLNAASAAERFTMIADALAKIQDVGNRNAISREIFGRNFSGNITGGAAGLEARANRHRELGGVMSTADVETAKEYNRTMKELGTVTKGIWNTLGAAAAPLVTTFYRFVVEVLIGVRKWLDTIRPILPLVFKIGLTIAAVGSAIAIIGGALFGVVSAIGTAAVVIPTLIAGLKVAATVGVTLAAVFVTIAAPLIILGGAVALLLYLFPQIGTAIASAFGAVTEYLSPWMDVFREVGRVFSAMWTGIINAIMGGEFQLAWEVAVAGVKLLWTQFVNFMRESWYAFKFMFTTVWAEMHNAVVAAMLGIARAVAMSVANIIDSLVAQITALVNRLPASMRDRLGLGNLNVNATAMVERNMTALQGQLSLSPNASDRELREERERAARENREAQSSLDALTSRAADAELIASYQREYDAWAAAAGTISEIEPDKIKEIASGSFSADALMGMFGGDSREARMERMQQQVVQLQQQLLQVQQAALQQLTLGLPLTFG